MAQNLLFRAQMQEATPNRINRFSFPSWLPVAASTAIMAVVAFVASDNVKQLNQASQWRRHSADVILSEQSVQNNLLEIQRGLRGYVTQGDTNALNAFYGNVAVEPSQLWELSAFTKDNPRQQQRARDLANAIAALISFDKKAIVTYQRDGFTGTVKLDKTGEGRAAFGRAQDILHRFSAEEQRLWDLRDVSEQNQYHYMGQFLVGACALAVALLLLAHHLASRELQFRRRAEEQLRQMVTQLKTALAEVKTLHGLIPICAWCKNVRSDSGYWQTVEQYVRSHSDADFSHGMCPNCATKFKQDITRANQKPETVTKA
jgi:CHASE3 domain sensor protein